MDEADRDRLDEMLSASRDVIARTQQVIAETIVLCYRARKSYRDVDAMIARAERENAWLDG